jgi:hypothetical protein
VLCLSGQIEREDRRVGAVVRDHDQLGRSLDAVDSHRAHELSFRLLHVRVAGPDDHVHRRDRLGAVRKRGDRLGPAHDVHLAHAAEGACGEDHVAAGRRHHQLLHARDARGHGAHQHGRRIRRAPAGRIDARPAHRKLAQIHLLAFGKLHTDRVVQLGLRHPRDVGGRELQRGADIGVD